jgi:hypothetical protein
MALIDPADQLENENRWEEAFRLRLARRAFAPDDESALLHLAFHCWYLIAEWPCISDGPPSEEISRVLQEVRIDLLRKFTDDADVLEALPG